MPRILLASLAALAGWAAPTAAQPAKGTGYAEKPTPEQLAFFEKKIRPVLVESCYKCHSAEAEKLKGELSLDTREGVRKGGATGPSIVPGNPEKSLLIKGIRHKDADTAMPPKGKLPDAVIADFEAWVKMGAPDPRDGKAVATAPKYVVDVEKGRSFWAFVPPRAAPVPQVANPKFEIRTEIDAFLAAAWDKKGIKPVGDADKRTLIRRVTLDLTGLPPTSDEVEAFAADTSAKEFEKVVDRLLASPRFGERWGRHWLDLARYAESTGKTANFNYPHAWRYRDYVIAAFNADKPYDQFIKEQLAGDLMPSADPKVRAERLVATGFLAIGPKALNENNGLQFELDVVDEQIDVTTQALLGITAACARCHDHKFDPIPTKDYYALAGIFRSTETCYGTVRFVQSQRPSPLLQLPAESAPSAVARNLTAEQRAALEKEIADLKKRIAESTDRLANILPSAQLALAQSKLDGYTADGTPKLQAMGVRDKPGRAGGGFGAGGFGPKGGFGMRGAGSRTIDDSPVYNRGEPDQPTAEKVPRGTLQVMSKSPLKVKSGSGRLELAEWIASRDNPLTARVMVNRVWMHLFGRGIVPTADNFGAAGQPPTNPELLDHLAIGFMDGGWSVKTLVKRVVMSHAYQLDSKFDKAAFEADPDNALVWRMSPRRLDAESLRDSMLAVSGQLDATPPVGSVVARAGEGPTGRQRLGGDQIATAINDPRNAHRSVYLPIVRDNLPEALALFDAPDPSLITADRPTTTVPSQGLFLLNNPFVLRSADAAAEKLLKSTTTDTERIRAAYLNFYGRPPGEKELATAEKFLHGFQAKLAKDRVPAARQERETWAAFCQALFASAEFQYRK
ncbi:PSD1 and planctomycete cytochrome C domain-containing protein [Gemmata sp.]|uniref:PSD1 and planctomycete cytochrome C domain-containing protein n=1 Tax=Gemmata sp. TaxID=1914242 RepID=UPI003F708F5F